MVRPNGSIILWPMLGLAGRPLRARVPDYIGAARPAVAPDISMAIRRGAAPLPARRQIELRTGPGGGAGAEGGAAAAAVPGAISGSAVMAMAPVRMAAMPCMAARGLGSGGRRLGCDVRCCR